MNPIKFGMHCQTERKLFLKTLQSLLATGTLTFLVPSGYAESVDTKVLNNDNSGGENGTIINNADNSVSVLINNNGTLPIFPTIKSHPPLNQVSLE
ncbi:hypothetical protein N42HA_01424 [Lactococcus lactis]|nr:hypothetical protein [Lactococcus lactis]